MSESNKFMPPDPLFEKYINYRKDKPNPFYLNFPMKHERLLDEVNAEEGIETKDGFETGAGH